jgi:hypothetical protein
MRLVKIPAGKNVERWINADLVTEIILSPRGYGEPGIEVSLQFGEYYIELRFRDRKAGMDLIHEIAGEIKA